MLLLCLLVFGLNLNRHLRLPILSASSHNCNSCSSCRTTATPKRNFGWALEIRRTAPLFRWCARARRGQPAEQRSTATASLVDTHRWNRRCYFFHEPRVAPSSAVTRERVSWPPFQRKRSPGSSTEQPPPEHRRRKAQAPPSRCCIPLLEPDRLPNASEGPS